MKRQDSGFAAAVAGAVLVSAGALQLLSGGLVTAVGAAAAGAGLASLGTRGSVVLALVGAWLLVSGIGGVAVASWNLMASGLAVTALGFLVGAVGSAAELPGGPVSED